MALAFERSNYVDEVRLVGVHGEELADNKLKTRLLSTLNKMLKFIYESVSVNGGPEEGGADMWRLEIRNLKGEDDGDVRLAIERSEMEKVPDFVWDLL